VNVQTLDIHLLGPVTVYAGGNRIIFTRRLRELAFAILVCAGDRHTSIESLIDRLWPDDDPDTVMPPNPQQSVYEIVAAIRRALNDAGVEGRAILPDGKRGYRLVIDRDCVDLHRFERLRVRARQRLEASDDEAVRLFHEAFREWGGSGNNLAEPFAGLSARWARNERDRLRMAYQVDLLDCVAAELRLGRHHELIPRLLDLRSSNPLDERIASLLMLAHYRAGQPAAAQQDFALLRQKLHDELGISPSAESCELHRRILQQDPGLKENVALPAPGSGASPTPVPGKGSIVADKNKNVAKNNSGPVIQVAKVMGDIHMAPTAPDGLAERAERLRRALRGGELTAEIASAAEDDLDRALARLTLADGPDRDGFTRALDDISRRVDGVGHIQYLVDDLRRRGQRGEE
jgi:DNA-binding SARP family transcriptional activator